MKKVIGVLMVVVSLVVLITYKVYVLGPAWLIAVAIGMPFLVVWFYIVSTLLES